MKFQSDFLFLDFVANAEKRNAEINFEIILIIYCN